MSGSEVETEGLYCTPVVALLLVHDAHIYMPSSIDVQRSASPPVRIISENLDAFLSCFCIFCFHCPEAPDEPAYPG
jgi:hypothetical protein